jgi:hypothetical protein
MNHEMNAHQFCALGTAKGMTFMKYENPELTEKNADPINQKSGGKVLFSTSFPETAEDRYRRMLKTEKGCPSCCLPEVTEIRLT